MSIGGGSKSRAFFLRWRSLFRVPSLSYDGPGPGIHPPPGPPAYEEEEAMADAEKRFFSYHKRPDGFIYHEDGS